MLAKINAELVKRGLPAATGVKTAVPGGKQNQTNTLAIVLGVLLQVIFIGVAAFAYKKYVHHPAAEEPTPPGSSARVRLLAGFH